MAATGQQATPAPGVSPLTTLARRADFLAAARSRRQARPGMMLQARRRDPSEVAAGIGVGFTCSRKVGNAVARNRAKRRLRAAARAVIPAAGRDGWDYVLVGRPVETASRPFAMLCDDLASALDVMHGKGAS